MMDCKSCGSEKLGQFQAEMGLHFRGLENLDKPIVWVFPVVFVCLDCGNSEFIVPERLLNVLRTGKQPDGVTV